MTRLCPKCEKDMKIVRFGFNPETKEIIPDVTPRFMCLGCGYQKADGFPKRTTIYLHSSKDSMYDRGRELGLTEEIIEEKFRNCLYELAVEIDVFEDGSYKIIGVKE